MKQLITILIVSLISNFAKSQVAVLQTVNDIAAYSDSTTTTLIIKDTIRGGDFLLYTGSNQADNGMIFTDANSNKWKRVTTDAKINVQWYGARSSYPAVDYRTEFIAARDYIYNHPDRFSTLYIPADTAGVSALPQAGYYISDSILFNHAITIEGDNSFGGLNSLIKIPTNNKGFVFQYLSGENGFGVTLKNFSIMGSGTPDLNYPNAHAITIRTKFYLKNVYSRAISGDGLHISACAIQPNGDNNNYGNADASVVESFTAKECRNGIFVEGCDANTIGFYNIDVATNRRWGFYDNGQLGNLYLKPHSAFNGRIGSAPAVSGSVVSYGGLYYAADIKHDGYFPDNIADSNYNKQPDISPTFWYKVLMQTANAWSPTYRYYSGGAGVVANVNARTSILNSYTESNQPPINLNTRSKVDGGDNGAGVKGGVFENVYSGKMYIFNSSLGLPNINSTTLDTIQKYLTISKPTIDYAAPLVVYNDQSKSGIVVVANFETTATSVYLGLKNPYSTGYIGYNVRDMNFYTDGLGGLKAQLNSSGFIPGSNNTLHIGSSSKNWKSGYFGTSLFSPIIFGSSSSAGNLTLSTTSHATKGNIFFGNASVYNETSGFFGLNTTTPSTYLDINSNKVRVRSAKTPLSASDTGNAGDICWDSSFIYICVATNTWKRAAISTW